MIYLSRLMCRSVNVCVPVMCTAYAFSSSNWFLCILFTLLVTYAVILTPLWCGTFMCVKVKFTNTVNKIAINLITFDWFVLWFTLYTHFSLSRCVSIWLFRQMCVSCERKNVTRMNAENWVEKDKIVVTLSHKNKIMGTKTNTQKKELE